MVAELKITQQRLQYLLKCSPAVIYSCKAQDDFGATFVSENITSILGYDVSEYLDDSRFWLNRIHPDDAPRISTWMSNLWKNEHYIHEYRFQHKNGNYLWIRDELKLIKDDVGNPIEIIGSWLDITKRKSAENALEEANQKLEFKVKQRTIELKHTLERLLAEITKNQENEERLAQKKLELEAIFEILPNFYFRLDAEGIIRDYKTATKQNLYLASEIFVGQRMQEILPSEERDRFEQAITKVLQTKSPTTFDYTLIFPAEEINLSARILPLKQQQIIIILRDISDQVQAKQQRDQFFKMSLDMLCICDYNGYFKQLNPAWSEILGWTLEELKAIPFIEFVHPDDREITILEGEKMVSGANSISFENRYRCKDNSYKWLLWTSKTLPEKQITYAVARDITERKAVEQELILSRKALESTSDAIGVADATGKVIYHNPAFIDLFEYTIEELNAAGGVPITCANLTDAQTLLHRIQKGESWSRELTMKSRSGKLMQIALRGDAIKDSKGKILGFIGIHTDISDRQRTEQALRESYSLLYSIIDSTPDLIFVKDIQGCYVMLNSSCELSLGRTIEQLIGKDDSVLYPPEIVSQIRETDWRIISTGVAETVEEVVSMNGKTTTYLVTKSPWRDSQKNIIGVIGLAREITERKAIEQALIERARVAAFRNDVDAALSQNDTLENIMQGCTEALVKHLDAAFARIWTLNKQENVLELQVSSGIYTHIDGPHRRVPVGKFKIGLIAEEGKPHLTNSVLTDERVSNKEWAKREKMTAFAGYPLMVQGEVLGVIAMFSQQILSESTLTVLQLAADEIAIGIKRKLTEEALRKSEAKIRAMLNAIPDLMFRLNREGIYLDFMAAKQEELAVLSSEIIGKSAWDLLPPDVASQSMYYTEQTLATGNIQIFEYQMAMQDELRDYEARLVPSGEDEVLAIIRDISERKQAEEALQALVAGTASVAGEEFFPVVVRHLAAALGVTYALVVQRVRGDDAKVRILAFWAGDNLGDNFEYELANTPCEIALRDGLAYYPSGVQQLFPLDQDLVQMQAESYLGASLIDTFGQAIGHIAVLDTKPILQEERAKAILSIFAARATTELQRQDTENALRKSEAKYREIAQREALINRFTALIRASLDVNTILEIAVTEIHKLFQIDRCSFFWYRQNGDESYWEGVKEARNPDLPSLLFLKATDTEIGPVATKTFNKEIIRIDDIETEVDPIGKEFFYTLGYTAFLSLPIQTQSGEIGAFTCSHCSGSRPWRDSEVELLMAVTDQLAIAIDQAKLYKQSHIAAETAHQKAVQLEAALRELSSTQSQLIQTEKMSSLGQLVAGIAHEINNPVNFIYGNIAHASQYAKDLLNLVELYQRHYCPPVAEIREEIDAMDLDFISHDLPKLLDSLKIGADRIRQIVLSLRNFSRLDEAEMKPVDIHEGINNTLLLLQQRFKGKPGDTEIKLIKEYGDLPLIECYPGQLNQVFMNLLANAIDAVEESSGLHTPQIRIRTEIQDNLVFIRIVDNGPGMTEEVRKRLFDPFFTTKPVGKGTGMGLSISYQIIVEKHRGKLQCISTPGQGAEFVVAIPLEQQE